MVRILFTDIRWPVPYAKWRLAEILSLVEAFSNVEFLVYNNIALNETEVNRIQEVFDLSRYDFIALNQSGAQLIKRFQHDTASSSPRQPTVPSNCGFQYLMRLKSNNHEVDWNADGRYDYVHHIFLMCYYQFSNHFPNFPKPKQLLHLHIGGGFLSEQQSLNISGLGGIITSQKITTELLKQHDYPESKIIPSYPIPFFTKHEISPPKKAFKSASIPLRICFTCYWDHTGKGFDNYVTIAKTFRDKYPDSTAEFLSIGSAPRSEGIQTFGHMSQLELSAYYSENVDIYVNLENGLCFNGWPLGTEALVCGSVLLTTDCHNFNKISGFNFTESEMFISEPNNIQFYVDAIAALDSDRHRLLKMSHKGQEKALEILSYNNHQAKYIDYIKAHFLS